MVRDERIQGSLDPIHVELRKRGYAYVETLGHGKDGVVEKYVDEQGHPFVIKRLHDEPLKDTPTKNAMHPLIEAFSNHKLSESRLNILQPLEIEGQMVGSIGRYESYIDTNDNSEPVERSSDLAAFLRHTFHPYTASLRTGKPIQNAFRGDGLSIMLAQLTQRLNEGVEALHQQRFLHLDIAARNIVVRLDTNEQGEVLGLVPVLIDFDRVQQLPKEADLFDYDLKEHPLLAFKLLDSHFFNAHQASVRTDIFGQNFTLLGSVGMALAQAHHPEELLMPMDNRTYMSQRRSVYQKHDKGFENDELVLNQCLNDVQSKILRHHNHTETDEARLFLKHFRTYLTTTPNALNPEHAHQERQMLLSKAINGYVHEKYQQLIGPKASSQKQDRIIYRLQQLGTLTMDSALKKTIQGTIKEMQNKQLESNAQHVAQGYKTLMARFDKHLNYGELTRGLEALRKIPINDLTLQQKISPQAIEQQFKNPLFLAKKSSKFSLHQLKKAIKHIKAVAEGTKAPSHHSNSAIRLSEKPSEEPIATSLQAHFNYDSPYSISIENSDPFYNAGLNSYDFTPSTPKSPQAYAAENYFYSKQLITPSITALADLGEHTRRFKAEVQQSQTVEVEPKENPNPPNFG